MSFEIYKESYAGAIKEISIGEGSNVVTVGGETCYPFYQFEGDMPHKPKIAMEVWDIKPTDWPEAAVVPFEDVLNDPSAWAKKCVNEYGAEIIVLQLKSIDPNGFDSTPEDASLTVKKVLDAINVPLIVWGIANAEKDERVFKRIAEDCQDFSLVLGPIEDKNHKSIGAAAMGYGHLIISSSPIDVNLAKQVNILLENLGMPMDKVLIDPTTGGLGYGLEYGYSVMERLRMAALAQGDDKLQMPIINNLGNEIWKCKEVKLGIKDAPLLGDPEKRGILMESVAAVAYLMAGSDILIMRHPESIRLIKSYIDLLMDGGDGMKVYSISKKLDEVDIDISSLSPIPNLSIEEEENKLANSFKEKTKDVSKIISDKSDEVRATKIIDEDKIKTKKENICRKPDTEGVLNKEKRKVELTNSIKIELERKLEEELKLKADLEVKIQKELKLKKEAKSEKAKQDAEKRAKEELLVREAKERERHEESLKKKRSLERSDKIINRKNENIGNISLTPASEQKDDFDMIIDKLNWVHKRVVLYKW